MDGKFYSKQRNTRKQHKSEYYKTFKGNKSEGQGFADKRKRKAKYEYMKLLKKERGKTGEDGTEKGRFLNRDRKQTPQMNRYSKEQSESSQRMLEKAKRKKEAIEKRRAQEDALQKYQDKKKANYKKICKKTYKGQPKMKDRIECLLSKIQNKVNQT